MVSSFRVVNCITDQVCVVYFTTEKYISQMKVTGEMAGGATGAGPSSPNSLLFLSLLLSSPELSDATIYEP